MGVTGTSTFWYIFWVAHIVPSAAPAKTAVTILPRTADPKSSSTLSKKVWGGKLGVLDICSPSLPRKTRVGKGEPSPSSYPFSFYEM
jgi:hypothetical protein